MPLALIVLAALTADHIDLFTYTRLIGAHPVPKEDFPEVLYIKSGSGYCSGTVVGPRVILTAAHCIDHDEDEIESFEGVGIFGDRNTDPVEDGIDTEFRKNLSEPTFTAKCFINPQYQYRQDYDFALCKASIEFEKFASIASRGPMLGDDVILAGFGSSALENIEGDGLLRIGAARVTELPSKDNKSIWFYTRGMAALTYGDSGGPAFKQSSREHHEIFGVNSRGDINSISLLAATYMPSARRWMRNFSARHDLAICGVTRTCGEKPKKPWVPTRQQINAQKFIDSAVD